ncbi:MAG: thioredoxin-disulfide reductase, partial [Candidatus Omnitrophica bacterium]|nr:thioredoxin-disulfide reductase [Candidatus Omnitrophota bacterium]
MEIKIELVIIGAGIGGVSAAIYAKRSGLDFIIFEPNAVGGQLLLMENIDNYVGLPLGTKGTDLAETLTNTLKDLDINIIKEEVIDFSIENNIVQLKTNNNLYIAKSIIIATGASFKKLNVKGEDVFSGKGVSYCAVCDGFFFRGKKVAVVGGGNTAVEEALYLSEIADKVILIHRRDELRALDYLKNELFEKSNIEVMFNSNISEIKGNDLLEELIVQNSLTGEAQSVQLQGLFIAVGIEPNTKIVKDIVNKDEGGFIITDEQMRTNIKTIWACGDCRKRPLKQLITAASEGATATIGVYKYLKGHYIS